MACALLTPLPLEAQDARRARPSSGSDSFAAPMAMPAVPTERTTVTGLALLGGSALAGARVETSRGAVGSTAPDGSFALESDILPGGRLVVRVEIVRQGQRLAGESPSVPVVAGGITDVGTIALAPGPSGPLFPGSQPTLRTSRGSFASADLDGDGDRDFVVATGTGGGFAAVLLNHGDALFAPAVYYPLGNVQLNVVTTGDLDGDLDVDVVIAINGNPFLGITSAVSVLRNDGDGTFAPAVQYEVGIADSVVHAVDLDGDRDLDLLQGNSGSPAAQVELSLLFNAGDGTFAPPIDYVVGEYRHFAPGDLDADGDVDIVVLPDPTGIVVWRNDGRGGLAADGSFPTGAGRADSLVIGDLDGDQDLDLVVESTESFSPPIVTLTLLENDGQGSFAPPLPVATLLRLDSMRLADLNGDGALDLAVMQQNELLVFPNLGAGTFGPAASYQTGLGSGPLVVGDLDGDAEVDLALGASSDRVMILLNDHERRLEAQLYIEADSPAGVLPVNVDADAELELVFANLDSASVSVLDRMSDGSFAPAVAYATGSEPLHVAASDLDGDGNRDLGVVNSDDASASILRNQGDGTFAPHIAYAIGGAPLVLALGDLDGDGADDLAVAKQLPSSVAVLLNDGAGAFGPKVDYSAGFLTTDVALGDLDRDGDLDCTVSTSSTGAFRVLLNQGDGTLALPVHYGTGSSEAVAVGDLDQDGDLDVVTTGAFQPSFVHHNQGDATYAPGLPLALVRGGRDVATADLDGDGDLEIALTTDVSSFVAVLPNTGDGTFGAPTEYFATVIASRSLGIGDLDGDRDLDLVTGGRPTVSPDAISVLWNRTRRLPRVVDPVADELVIDVVR